MIDLFGYRVNIHNLGNWCHSNVIKKLNVPGREKCDPGPGGKVNGEII